jgi:hypothetical protein
MWHQASRDKRDKKMKGLAVTILLAILEIGAITANSGDSLLSDGPPIPASRREEAGIQAEVLVDAERAELAGGHQLGLSETAEGRLT